ncbi:Cytochrome c oxidase subunit 6C-1 [Papilio machaon]|uniref:Cytochrome c oxidase subunit 6C-1 n=1 Tax=Papilio machaon TaxID=76193 RepID=A0A0N0PFL0_PAPMA|nr:Cytochrome c oxidase subunit 6C-1 [Papilio machaon]
MADKAVSTIAKPQMRGLLNNVIKRNLITAITLAAVAGFSFKQLVGNERKRRYAEFYRTYDARRNSKRCAKKVCSNPANLLNNSAVVLIIAVNNVI